ncbi:MAG: Holliday junction resolvase RuvX [Gammaproteobacteria bacterium]|nr:MAG: Holliday junction resolvase RuvX [Gammaproteobacteria bacterium]
MPESYLGFDFGTKRLGIATGQSVSKTATPLTILDVSRGIQWEKITAIIDEWHPSALIVGLPLTADGTETPIIQAINKFIRQLAGRYHLPIHTIDEHLSSHTAKNLLNRTSTRKIAPLDASAAAVILQTWLELNEHN